MRNDLERGSVVLSLAGHDQGRLFVVLERIDEHYVWIADGDTRPIEKPKRKKRKHLRLTPFAPMEIRETPQLMNADIRKFLKKYVEK